MKTHRWWLALIAALLTPWIGPHVDHYLPIGWVLIQVRADAPDLAFWVISGVLFCVAYIVWLGLFSAFAALIARSHGSQSGSNGHT